MNPPRKACRRFLPDPTCAGSLRWRLPEKRRTFARCGPVAPMAHGHRPDAGRANPLASWLSVIRRPDEMAGSSGSRGYHRSHAA
jgi:hypothetical protein